MRHLVLLLAVLVFAPACGRRAPCNVVLVVIDTLRADHCSAFGYARPTTPNLERLAADGVRFERAWSQAAWTLPSMVSLMTGRYVLANYSAVPESARMLAERFHDAGYHTAAIVANPLLFSGTGFERGFDEYRVADWDKRNKTLRADRLVDQAREVIGKLEEPFFVWLHLFDPHDPYMPPPRLTPAEDAGTSAEEFRKRQPIGAEPVGEAAARQLNAMLRYYDGEIAFADEGLGGVLDLLETSGRLDRTVVAVTADHGEGMFSHADNSPEQLDNPYRLYRSHGDHMYEEALHVPMVLRGGAFRGGERRADPVENVDLFATLLAAAGLPADPGAAGQDLAGAARKSAVFAFGTHHHAVRTRTGAKLIHPVAADRSGGRKIPLHLLTEQGARRPQFYRLDVDPAELENRQSSAKDDVELLTRLLREWQDAHASALSDAAPVSQQMQQRLRQLGYVR